MTPYDFVQLTLYAAGGKIRGKTRLQKTVYFLGLLTETRSLSQYSYTTTITRGKTRNRVSQITASWRAWPACAGP